jgi:hypothetical protein
VRSRLARLVITLRLAWPVATLRLAVTSRLAIATLLASVMRLAKTGSSVLLNFFFPMHLIRYLFRI